MMSLASFKELCAEQAVDVEWSPPPADIPAAPSYAPNDVCKTIVQLARHITSMQGHGFAQKQLFTLPPEHYEDVPAVTLTNMLNDGILPQSGPSIPLSDYVIDGCSFAEIGFADTIRYFDRTDATPEHRGAQIIIDESGAPLFVRKQFGKASALSLQDVTIAGYRHPAGSLLRLDLDGDARVYWSDEPKPYVPDSIVEIITDDHIRAARFQRLTAYALHPDERQFACTDLFTRSGMYSGTGEILRGSTLTDFQTLASLAVDTVSSQQA